MKRLKNIFRKHYLGIFLMLFGNTLFAQERFQIQGEAQGKDGQPVQLVRYTTSGLDRLDQDTVHGGAFYLSSAVDEITPVVIRIGDAFNGTVIMEPKAIQVVVKPDNAYAVNGGMYNPILMGYLHSGTYRKADQRFRILTKGGDTQSVKGTEDEWEMIQLFLRMQDLRSHHLDSVFHTTSDPIVQALAAIMNELQPDRENTMATINAVGEQLGENSIKMQRIRSMDRQQIEMQARRHAGMVGESFTDFTAPTLAGKPVSLEPIVKQHAYTLLQFWASWCGPCRKEIPLLKELYAAFHDKGFEIVSFSLDDNRHNWEKASEIEQLGWYNLSDLRAFESPIVKRYPIMGIPANVIIDQQGKIIASNLTDQDLEDKIRELFP